MKLNLRCIVFALLLSTGLNSCKKENNPPVFPEETEIHEVTFNLNGFSSIINPLASDQQPRLSMSLPGQNSLLYGSNALQSNENLGERLLYFWSFNQSDLLPDLALAQGASLDFIARNTGSFPVGFPHELYPAGNSFSTAGTSQIDIALPLTDIFSIDSLSFDLCSSGTGPNAFRLSYSLDGTDFIAIAENNQFMNYGSFVLNAFVYDLTSVLNLAVHQNIVFRIEPFAGIRGSDPDYNVNSGTFRIDNIAVMGTRQSGAENRPTVSKLHYYVFNAENGDLITEGDEAFDLQRANSEVRISLPSGEYYATFITNTSMEELLVPTALQNTEEFVIGNPFSNAQAIIFGERTPRFPIDVNNFSVDVTLNRLFSNIKFEFTDDEDLAHVSKIVITRQHGNFFYMPFGWPTSIPSSDASMITFETPFLTEEKTISFNQFLGSPEAPEELEYMVTVYGEDDSIIRYFTVANNIRNNVQLVFTGKLLEGTDRNGGFAITLNETWNEQVELAF